MSITKKKAVFKKKKSRFLTNFKLNSLRAFQTLILDTDYISSKTFSLILAACKDSDTFLDLLTAASQTTCLSKGHP